MSKYTMIHSNTDPLSCDSYQTVCPYIQKKEAGFDQIVSLVAKQSNVLISLFVRGKFSLLYTA